jgi:hypothetical protein
VSAYRENDSGERVIAVDLPNPMAGVLAVGAVVLVAFTTISFAVTEQIAIRHAAVATMATAVIATLLATLTNRFLATRTQITLDAKTWKLRAERVKPSGRVVDVLFTAPLVSELEFVVDEERTRRGPRQVLRLKRGEEKVGDVQVFGNNPIDAAFVAQRLPSVIEKLNSAIADLAR